MKTSLLYHVCAGLLFIASPIAHAADIPNADDQQLLEDARAAIQKFDGAAAIEKLDRYLQKHPDDLDAIRDAVMARLLLPQVDDKQREIAWYMIRRYVKERPNDLRGRQLYLSFLVTREEFEEAYKTADWILKRDPRDLNTLWTKVSVAEKLGHTDDAADALARYAELAPPHYQTQILVVQAMRRLNRPGEEIVAHAEKLMQANPNDGRLKLVAGAAAAASGRRKEAIGWLRDAAAEKSDEVTYVESICNWLDFVGLTEEAARLALDRTATLKDDGALAGLAASFLGRADKWDQALAAARLLRANTAESQMTADVMVAECLLNLKDPSGALKQLDGYLRAAREKPDEYEQVIATAARAMIANNQTQKADALLWPLTEKSDLWRATWMDLAKQFTASAGARTWLEKIQGRISEDDLQEQLSLADAWQSAGLQLKDDGLIKGGIERTRAIESNPKADAEIFFILSNMAERRKDRATSAKYLRKSLELKSDFATAQNNLAMILADDPQTVGEAMELAKKAVAAQPNSAFIQDTVAYVAVKSDDFPTAVDALTKAANLAPGEPFFRINLAWCLLKDKKRPAAKRLFKEVEAMGIDESKLIDPAPERLKELRGEFGDGK